MWILCGSSGRFSSCLRFQHFDLRFNVGSCTDAQLSTFEQRLERCDCILIAARTKRKKSGKLNAEVRLLKVGNQIVRNCFVALVEASHCINCCATRIKRFSKRSPLEENRNGAVIVQRAERLQ